MVSSTTKGEIEENHYDKYLNVIHADKDDILVHDFGLKKNSKKLQKKQENIWPTS